MPTKRVLITVPGRIDRAFYKVYVKRIAELHDAEYVDLDSSSRVSEKRQLIQSVAPQGDQANPLRRISAAQLVSGNTALEVVIWPLEGEYGEAIKQAWLLLDYQLGLETPTISHFVIARDIEQGNASKVLKGLENSLKSRFDCITKSSATRRGQYYTLLHDLCGKDINLLLIAQGLEQNDYLLGNLDQHAVEDFIIYIYRERLLGLLNECPWLQKISRSSRGHKKLASIAAIDACRAGVDERFLANAITVDSVKNLCEIHDGLRELRSLLNPSSSSKQPDRAAIK